MGTRAHLMLNAQYRKKINSRHERMEVENKFKASGLNSIEKNCFIIHSMHADINFFDADLKAIMICNVEQTTGSFIMLFFMQNSSMLKETTMMMMHPYLANEGEENRNKELYFAIYSIMHIHFTPCYVIQQQKRT